MSADSVRAKSRSLLRERSDRICEVCGLARATNAHHRKNRSQGGGDELSNLLDVCGSGTTGCHGWITENPATSYLNGWSVRQPDSPLEVPVFYRGTFVVLDDLGNMHAPPESCSLEPAPATLAWWFQCYPQWQKQQ